MNYCFLFKPKLETELFLSPKTTHAVLVSCSVSHRVLHAFRTRQQVVRQPRNARHLGYNLNASSIQCQIGLNSAKLNVWRKDHLSFSCRAKTSSHSTTTVNFGTKHLEETPTPTTVAVSCKISCHSSPTDKNTNTAHPVRTQPNLQRNNAGYQAPSSSPGTRAFLTVLHRMTVF